MRKDSFPVVVLKEKKKKQNAVITMLGGFDFKTENLLPTNGVINDMFGWVEKK